MIRVLLLGSGTQSLALIKDLHRLGAQVYMLSEERDNYGDRSNLLTKRFCSVATSPMDYLAKVIEILDTEHIDCLIPMGDESAIFVSKNKDILLQHSHFKCPDFFTFQKGYDKNKLMSTCRSKGYPHPYTLDMSIVDMDSIELKDFPFPAMLKPNCTTGGRGMVEVDSYYQLLAIYPDLHKKYGEYHLQRFIKPGGRQVKIQLYVNERQELLASSVLTKVRWYPNKGGSNCCATSVINNKIVGICHQLLSDIGWIGFADFDTIEDPDTGELLIMEINPRVPACIKGSIVAGVDWGEIIVNDSLGKPVPDYEYVEGVCLRHLGLDLLWFTHAENKWTTTPSWFKFIGRNIYYQDMNGWRDPMPFVCGTLHNFKKLFDSDFRKAKKGV